MHRRTAADGFGTPASVVPTTAIVGNQCHLIAREWLSDETTVRDLDVFYLPRKIDPVLRDGGATIFLALSNFVDKTQRKIQRSHADLANGDFFHGLRPATRRGKPRVVRHCNE